MAKEKKEINQPQREDEQELSSIINNESTAVVVRGSTWKIKYLKKGAIRKITSLMLNDKEKDDTISTKACAIMRLNSYWGIKLFYPILWRWMFYIKEYTDTELLPYIAEGKKKVESDPSLISIMLLTAMKDTVMMMTRKEAEHIQAEQIMAQRGVSQKSTAESPNQQSSSEG